MIDCKECNCEETNDNEKRNECGCKMNMERRKMIDNIKELDFTIIELGLYLDTHPDDKKAICMHNEYTKQVKDLKDKYQKVYGPLTIFYPCNKWRWLEEPWAAFILKVNSYLSFF